MKTIICAMGLMLLFLFTCATGWAEVYEHGEAFSSGELFSPEELDDLLAPIALYPDPLVAQILPAATFVDQIDEAARFVRQYGETTRIDSQPWDVSVRAVAHYPSVLFMMDNKYEWTVSLGQAFVNQEQEVMDTIQNLRAEARNVGSLASTPQQQVVVEGDNIRILPAEPEVIYVPQYDPTAVYMADLYPSYGFITFSAGFGIGAWLNRDCDWHRHRIYYHGWRGGGWINRTRPYVNTRNRAYIDRRYREIEVNRRVVQHDTATFRTQLRRKVELRREQGRIPRSPDHTFQRRSRVAPPTTAPAPAAPSREKVTPAPERSRRLGTESVPYSGYGGYGKESELKTYRQRGRMSRDSLHQSNRQSLSSGAPPAPASAGRPASPAPAGRSAPAPAIRQAPPASAPATRSAPQAPSGGNPSRQRR